MIALALSGNIQKTLAYVLPNLGFLNFVEPTLPGNTVHGLFGSYEGIVNGALWTLKIEVMFYMALPFIWWVMKRLPKLQITLLVLMMIGAEIWRYVFTQQIDHNYAAQLARQLPGQMGYFAAGMYMWLNWERIKSPQIWWPLLGLVLVSISVWETNLHIVRPIGLALIIASIAFAAGPALNAAKFGDMSYGVYITHFPIIQACIAAGLYASPLIGLAVSLGLTFVASFILWHLIEKRALLPSSHYRKIS